MSFQLDPWERLEFWTDTETTQQAHQVQVSADAHSRHSSIRQLWVVEERGGLWYCPSSEQVPTMGDTRSPSGWKSWLLSKTRIFAVCCFDTVRTIWTNIDDGAAKNERLGKNYKDWYRDGRSPQAFWSPLHVVGVPAKPSRTTRDKITLCPSPYQLSWWQKNRFQLIPVHILEHSHQ